MEGDLSLTPPKKKGGGSVRYGFEWAGLKAITREDLLTLEMKGTRCSSKEVPKQSKREAFVFKESAS